MTSTQIRQSFLDFFKSKQHTIVPSSSLMPDSPNLLFTNAGMNQFVPIFLGQTQCPYTPGRAADTQKCIRAGGKHNDLDDVGLDTYHHTFFEMLGNWSFGDYFKQEAIEWAWELVVEVWKFPPERIYATVFCPQMGCERWEESWNSALASSIERAKKIISGEPVLFDKGGTDAFKVDAFAYVDGDAAFYWAEYFLRKGLDPSIHIVPGNKKDNFWMMGETGPCGPCTEVHVDLRPGPAQTDLEAQKSGRALVNGSDARCIEIWNNVFIQYNANPDGSFTTLPAKHVDTGMGFERVTSIIQGTKNLTDFANAKISNYETDIFRPIFDAIEKLSGKKYGSTLPKSGSTGDTEQEKIDVAFRVIADHIRTLSFAIADGIQPGNNDRNYVLRRILRRAVRYGRTLGFHEPFFYKLVDVLADTMGDVFPEIRAKKKHVQDVIRIEEESFNKTLDRGIELFTALSEFQINENSQLQQLLSSKAPDLEKRHFALQAVLSIGGAFQPMHREFLMRVLSQVERNLITVRNQVAHQQGPFANADILLAELKNVGAELLERGPVVSGDAAFVLYDTYGFPLDLTELMARERGLKVEVSGFNALMEKQKSQSQAAQKKEVISLSQIETTTPTKFVGFDNLAVQAKVVEVVSLKDKTAVILDTSACYAEMGGQVGDTGEIVAADVRRGTPGTTAEPASSPLRLQITNTQKSGNTWLHFVDGDHVPAPGDEVFLRVDRPRRNAIERHHTVTHLLHWALHQVVSKEASQKGSFVGPDKLTFDFNSAPLTPAQVADIEKLVNERILENAGVSWTEVPYRAVKSRKDVMQFFGDKYGDTVRVVQIGGYSGKFDGYSMELCGGTHTRATGEIGLFRIVGESAIAAGVRRIEAVAGLEAYNLANSQLQLIKSIAGKVNSPVHELESKIAAMLEQQKSLEKSLKAAQQREASNAASELLERVHAVNGIPAIIHNVGAVDGDFLQMVVDALKSQFKGVIVLGGGPQPGSVALVASVSSDFSAKVQAGKIIQTIAPIVGGKGGGKPDNARGGGKDASKLDEALAKAKSLLG